MGSGLDGLRARVLARAAGAGQSPLALARTLEDGVDADTVGLVPWVGVSWRVSWGVSWGVSWVAREWVRGEPVGGKVSTRSVG